MAAKRIVPRSVSPEVLKLINDKPKLQESHWILESCREACVAGRLRLFNSNPRPYRHNAN